MVFLVEGLLLLRCGVKQGSTLLDDSKLAIGVRPDHEEHLILLVRLEEGLLKEKLRIS